MTNRVYQCSDVFDLCETSLENIITISAEDWAKIDRRVNYVVPET